MKLQQQFLATTTNASNKSDILFNLNTNPTESDENNNLHLTKTTTTTTTTTKTKFLASKQYLDSLVDKLNHIDFDNDNENELVKLAPSNCQKTLLNSSTSLTSSTNGDDQTLSSISSDDSSSRSVSRNQSSQSSFNQHTTSSSSGCSSSSSTSRSNSSSTNPSYSTITSLKGHPFYKIQEKIRSGGFGDVYKGTRKYDQLPIAIKIISKKKINSWTMV